MTVNSLVTEVTAAGNGATTIFSFSPVKIFASSHLLVKRIDAGGGGGAGSSGYTGAGSFSLTI
jgi:hypothetical protein